MITIIIKEDTKEYVCPGCNEIIVISEDTLSTLKNRGGKIEDECVGISYCLEFATPLSILARRFR